MTGDTDTILELSCNLDDMTGEELDFAMEDLLDAGALDVYTTPIGMKKCRPGTMLSVLCRPEKREEMVAAIFRHTTTLGIRETEHRRYILRRQAKTLQTPVGPIGVKISQGYGVRRCKPEYEDLRRAAEATGKSLPEIRRLLNEAKEE